MIPARIVRLIDAVYVEPQPFASAEQFARAYHEDIPGLTLEGLDAERILARLKWAVTIHHRDEPSRWLLDRLAHLDQAATKIRSSRTARR